MRGRKKARAILAVLCAALCLSSCVNAGIPVQEEQSYTLPDAQSEFVAPIGDASLDYTAPVLFYLPRHDGNRLTSVTNTIPLSEGRLTAESVVRLLLEQSGSSIASPLGGEREADALRSQSRGGQRRRSDGQPVGVRAADGQADAVPCRPRDYQHPDGACAHPVCEYAGDG